MSWIALIPPWDPCTPHPKICRGSHCLPHPLLFQFRANSKSSFAVSAPCCIFTQGKKSDKFQLLRWSLLLLKINPPTRKPKFWRPVPQHLLIFVSPSLLSDNCNSGICTCNTCPGDSCNLSRITLSNISVQFLVNLNLYLRVFILIFP